MAHGEVCVRGEATWIADEVARDRMHEMHIARAGEVGVEPARGNLFPGGCKHGSELHRRDCLKRVDDALAGFVRIGKRYPAQRFADQREHVIGVDCRDRQHLHVAQMHFGFVPRGRAVPVEKWRVKGGINRAVIHRLDFPAIERRERNQERGRIDEISRPSSERRACFT